MTTQLSGADGAALAPPGVPAVLMEDIRKSYNAHQALKGIDLEFMPGTINALVGENGAGKSTALGILSGRTAPTSGRVTLFGRELSYGDPRASRRAGVAAIYQELTIVPALSAEENVFLADRPRRAGLVDFREMRRRYEALCERTGVPPAPPRTPAGRLSVSEAQLLEILRALVADARIVLFDEPSAALAAAEREALYRLIRGLKDDGITIVFVSHNLDEVLDLSDTITVFRDGELIRTGARTEFTKSGLVSTMIGDKGDRRVAAELIEPEVSLGAIDGVPVARRTRLSSTPIVQARGVTVPRLIADIDVDVYAGEILGVGGLVGSGRTTLMRALAGLEPRSSGRLWIDGVEVRWPHTVRRALSYGIALIPEDRRHQGLVLPMSAMDNIAISRLSRAGRWGFYVPRTLERAVTGFATAFGLDPRRLHTPAWQLSGGNQQKLLLARWQNRRPRVLLADEPTRGIDVGAKAEILASFETMAAEGLGIAIVSSELEEVAAVSDRVIVLSEGEQVGLLEKTADTVIAVGDILAYAFRATDELHTDRDEPDSPIPDAERTLP
ncbi:sugar ABC transporter ATP-binding protein [Cnuibacter physcomitrellae]|uniref:sugar ABC transporter ATP-binding protein n=1 Tax=Cnuibacter physcomitrellae TaxID=1619308 RepID=UPI002175EFA8|nr:sugar ABC transporter ATP-binding protein [Cnuibacter physcomitrellae]MCS5498333.1 sugar ABC transporter ATP-binding protein [Cnuibacter physcomitrellae]